MKRAAVILLFISLFVRTVVAQSNSYLLPAQVVDGDTVAQLELSEVTITPSYTVSVPVNPAKYNKLIRDVKKVYPYSVIAGIKLKEYNDLVAQATSDADKKEKLKEAEDTLKKQFTADIENMTTTQGIILVKLIYRETGVTSYDIVKELRGSLRAIFYQGLARLFGENLKLEYDPTGKDKAIEDIVKQIESGTL